MKDVGGLSRTAEVIDGLVEEGLNFTEVESDFFSLGPVAHIQRLGYILDEALGYREVADGLFTGATKSGARFKHTLLVPAAGKDTGGFPTHPKWKVAANKEIELD